MGIPSYPDDWATKFAEIERRLNDLAAAAASRVPFTGGTLTEDLTIQGDLTVGGGIEGGTLLVNDIDALGQSDFGNATVSGTLSVGGTLTATGALTVGGAPVYLPLVARKTANEVVNNSNTLQDDDHMGIAVAAGAVYLMDGFWIYGADPAADIKIGFTGPAGATLDWVRGGMDAAATVVTGGFNSTAQTLGSFPSLGAVTGVGTILIATPMGTLVTGGTAGTLRVQWAQQTAQANNATIYAQSWLRLQRIS